jgi:pimeloyl-ACP methyl ester carboxylesterase
MLRKIGKFLFRLLIILSTLVFFLSVFIYSRIINPFIKLKTPPPIVSTHILSKKITIIDGMKYSYWTNGIENPEKIVVMLPPSTNTGDIFENAMSVVPKRVLVIAPDYPGRGDTDEIKELDTMPAIAMRTSRLLKSLVGEKSVYIIAPSLGGAIGTEIVKENELNVKKIFLIATGEFFAPDQKFIFRILFTPPIYSERLRNSYENFIIGKLGLFTNVKRGSTKNILEQVLAVINYKVDTSFTTNIPTVIVTLTEDKLVDPKSLIKLQEVFKNSNVFSIKATHDRKLFSSEEMLRLIKDNL